MQDPVEEHKRECLAAWVIEHFAAKYAGEPNAAGLAKADRADWLAEFGKNKPRLLADVKARIQRQWGARRRG